MQTKRPGRPPSLPGIHQAPPFQETGVSSKEKLAGPPASASAAAAYDGVTKPATAVSHPTSSPMTLIAHRGASLIAPEHTLAAFEAARRLGTPFLEADVQLSAPSKETGRRALILCHDATLERTTNARELFPDRSPWRVSDFTPEELQTLDAGSWFKDAHPEAWREGFRGLKLMRLDQLVEVASRDAEKGPGLYIEIKDPQQNPGVEEALIDELRGLGWINAQGEPTRPLVVESFSGHSLKKTRSLAPGVQTILLADEKKPWQEVLDDAKRVGATSVGPIGYKAWPWNVWAAHHAGLKVTPWVINKPWQMMVAKGLGTDGVFTDAPEVHGKVTRADADAMLQAMGYGELSPLPPVPKDKNSSHPVETASPKLITDVDVPRGPNALLGVLEGTRALHTRLTGAAGAALEGLLGGRVEAVDTSKSPALTGRVLHRPKDGEPRAAWDKACVHFSKRIKTESVEPRTIVYPRSAQDVSNAVRFAKENQIPFRIRSGGHSYEAMSMVKDGLVIDVTDLDQIDVKAGTQRVTIGAGARCLDVLQKLAAYGLVLPAPTFPSVGIAGATLGGGVGMTSRKLGTLVDRLESAKLINAQGQLVTASSKENPDLFWALKGGGGGNFGAVTELTFNAAPAQNVVAIRATWKWDDFGKVFDAWQRWSTTTDTNMSCALDLKADGTISMFAQYTPDDDSGLDAAETSLEELLAEVPALTVDNQVVPLAVAARAFGQVSPTNPNWRQGLREEQTFKSTSTAAPTYLPKEAIDKIRQRLENAPKFSGENYDVSMLRLLAAGGAVSAVPSDASALYHRQLAFLAQLDGYWPEAQAHDEKVEGTVTTWVQDMRRDMAPWTRGAYVNYHDALLDKPLVEYFGGNLPRLIEVKAKYDPDNVFSHPHGLPTHLTKELENAVRRWEQGQG
jgi:FAD/FMN-containing dehydrogenase/glycerophosphoryl diester phosphodiesterase